MLKILLFFILVCATSFGLLWLFENDGIAIFEWFGYIIEIKTSALIIFLVFASIILYFLIGIIFKIFGLPSLFSKYRKESRDKRDFKLVEKSIISILSGNNDEAKKSIEKLVLDNKKSESNKYGKLTHALSARLAYSEGNLTEAEYKYKNLLDSKDTEFFAVKGLFESAFLEGDIDKAIKHAEKAYKLNPKIKNGAHSLLELYKKAERWDDAIEFVNNYKRSHRFSEDLYNKINTEDELALLWYKKAAEIFEKYNDKPSLVETSYNYMAKVLKKKPYEKEYISKAIEICLATNKNNKIQSIIEKSWSNTQDYDLAVKYIKTIQDSKIEIEEKKRLKAIERLKKINNNEEVFNSLHDWLKDKSENEITI